jgi:uncharacterized protein YjbI with pentapeptide repeats
MVGRREGRVGTARWASAPARWVSIGALGVTFVLWLVLFAPRLLAPAASLHDVPDAAKRQELRTSQLKLQNDVRTTLLQGLGGLAVTFGAVFTYRQLQHNIKTSGDQREHDRQQQEIERQGQITERFTRAIDQLGHENLDVRLGGIYALERIAGDSSQDRSAIIEVLTAFVRGHAPWPPSFPSPQGQGGSTKDLPAFQARAHDVQAALTVLCRPPIGPAVRLDLAATDLRGVNLRGALLQQANLFRAQLQTADLQHAYLRAADLRRAQLQEADLQHAHLQGANLDRAQLRGAYLQHAQLQGADLGDAELQGANLGEAQLQEANLRSALLRGANLGGAELKVAKLGGAQLQEANLGGAQLQEAWLRRAQLQGADLRRAQLNAADLRDAQLQGADLRDTQLQRADLGGARLQKAQCNAETAWPAGFDWHAAGVIAEEDRVAKYSRDKGDMTK